jgi:PKD repeat protein
MAGHTVTTTRTITVNDPPVAGIGQVPETRTTGDTITLTSTSTDPDGDADITQYDWDIDGDGAYGGTADRTGQTVTTRFTTAGTHTVHLRVTDSAGHTAVASKDITVDNAWPVAGIGASPQAPTTFQQVTLSSTSTDADGAGDITAVCWDFDGDFSTCEATSPTTITSFPTAGTHNVRLRVTDSVGHAATAAADVVVADSPPQAGFAASPADIHLNDAITLTSTTTDPDGAADIADLCWDLDGDASTCEAHGPTTTARFAAPGRHVIRLVATDVAGRSDTAVRTLVVKGAPPVASFTVDNVAPYPGDPVKLTSTSQDADGDITDWSWDLNDDSVFGDETGQVVTTSFATRGPHTVALRVTDSSDQTDTHAVTINVADPPPIAGIELVSPAAPTVGETVTLKSTSQDDDLASLCWDLDGDPATCDADTETVTTSFSTPGPHTIRLKVTDASGQSAAASIDIGVTHAPVALFDGPSPTPTTRDTITFTSHSTDADDDIDTLSWDFDGDRTYGDATGPTATHRFRTPGAHSVWLKVTDRLGHTAEASLTFTVDEPPPALIAFKPIADADVTSKSPGRSYGTAKTLRVQWARGSSGTAYKSYLRFGVAGIDGRVVSVKLRLNASDASPDGGDVFLLPASANAWAESGPGAITWRSAPALPATRIGTAGRVSNGLVTIDLGTAITQDGTYTLALANHSADSATYASRESAAAPQLLITYR